MKINDFDGAVIESVEVDNSDQISIVKVSLQDGRQLWLRAGETDDYTPEYRDSIIEMSTTRSSQLESIRARVSDKVLDALVNNAKPGSSIVQIHHQFNNLVNPWIEHWLLNQGSGCVWDQAVPVSVNTFTAELRFESIASNFSPIIDREVFDVLIDCKIIVQGKNSVRYRCPILFSALSLLS